MSKGAEQHLAANLLFGLQFVWFAMIGATIRLKRKSIIAAPAVAAVLGYCCFVAAALLAGAKFPEFMRDHLFDGLAPAAAVAFLVNLFPTKSLDKALMWIRRPVLIVVLFCAGGALIFGAIAWAAVFISGSDDFTTPVWTCALWGGVLFGIPFLSTSSAWWPWPTKQPARAAIPGPGGSEDSATPVVADAAEGGAAPPRS